MHAFFRYLRSKSSESPPQRFQMNLRDFVQSWVNHHEYWQMQRIPTTVVRFEDFVGDPWGSLKRVLRASGLWDLHDLTGNCRSIEFESAIFPLQL